MAPGVALLTAFLCLTGTSLLSAAVDSDWRSVLLFAIVAALVFESARVDSPRITYLAWVAAALVPLAARYLLGAEAHSLFGPDNGFVSLRPATYVALAGTLAFAGQHRFWASATLALLTLWFVTGADLTAAIALLAPGLAWTIDWARRRPLVAVAPLVVAAIAWNYWLMVQYTATMVPKDAPVSFAAMVRQQADVHTRAPYVYPFAFPANVLFAWREGVPIDRYDVLSIEPRREDIAVVIERGAERFLLDGWGPPGANETGPFRWIDGPRATLALPLQPPSTSVSVEILTTARGDAPTPPTELQFEMNGHAIGRARVSPLAPAEPRLVIAASDVGRVLRAGYNRLSIVTSGHHRIAIHRVRIAPAP